MVNNFDSTSERRLQPLRNPLRSIAHAAAHSIALARVAARVGLRTGVAFRFTPRGVLALARSRVRGSLGPANFFRIHAANQPDAIAIVHEGRSITYGDLDRRIDRVASRLRHEHGIRRRDSAILMLRNRPEFVELQAAMSRLGGAAVSASWRSTPDELEYLASHSGARAIFVEAEVADAVIAARSRLRGIPEANVIAVGGERPGLTSYENLVADRGPIPPIEEASGEEAAVVVYTSGTTGKPKGAVRRFPKEAHLNFLQALDELDLRADDRHLAVCPLYHSTAFGFATFSFLLGGTVVIETRFSPESWLARVEEHQITTTAMVPTMLHRVLEVPERVRRRYDTRSLRRVFSGGAPLSGTLARAFIEEFGHVLYNFYGATETGINTLATPEELLRSPGTIGHAIPGNEIRILDDEGREVPRGTTGELFVRNAMLATYHGDDEATRASMRNGFFSVGDLAHIDEHGLFHIDGRKRDMIISGGVNVYPAEVEEVIARHPAVAEVAVVGVEDREWGERVRAVVALRAGAHADPAELLAWCRERLSGPKVPREFRVLPELPKNPTGKILKRELVALP
jgi:fatty-acyl-CoA synthase